MSVGVKAALITASAAIIVGVFQFFGKGEKADNGNIKSDNSQQIIQTQVAKDSAKIVNNANSNNQVITNDKIEQNNSANGNIQIGDKNVSK